MSFRVTFAIITLATVNPTRFSCPAGAGQETEAKDKRFFLEPFLRAIRPEASASDPAFPVPQVRDFNLESLV